MGHGKALTNQEYRGVIVFHDGDVSLREISRKTGRSRTCIRKTITAERGPQIDSGSEVQRAERRPALTEREVRQLARAAATGEKFAAELKTDLGIKPSVRPVQRLLKRVDHLVYTKVDRTLPLTSAHKAARISWVEEHILNPGIWKYTNYYDEKKFNLDGPDDFKYYWCDIRQPPQSYVCRQNGGGSVMVLGAFSTAEYMLPFAHTKYGIDFVFQQDNASIHASHCNPIENLWSAIAARLVVAVLNAWAATEEANLQKLVDSMPRRCLAVIKAKGSLTKY
ncbi:transposable element Tc3 Transposase [Phytophthora palmivora]|uniref:Transposable element Tc3 Transposase n=1 Tax=Phytophthora palmivora TaxID=4796 RepID=A0A2P4Y1L9_9STRA|nr:transposable element Tc3 Transposase [Phytophthora palmivora]